MYSWGKYSFIHTVSIWYRTQVIAANFTSFLSIDKSDSNISISLVIVACKVRFESDNVNF